jgi:pimeloyl-ACP methyl ester carboxylesterase
MSDDLNYNPDLPLYISPNQRFAIDDAHKALEVAYSKDKPVVIYIHGRAKNVGEPAKSEKKNIYKDLADYGISVIGFTWDADDGGYDETRPIASADDFDLFLKALKNYLSTGTGTDKDKPSLIAHSMGNIIVAELAEEDRLTVERGKLFKNIIFSSAAVKSKRHHKWLRKIDASERNYIMVNPKDPMLGFAGYLFKPNMLGREIRKPGVSIEHGFYIHLGRLDVGHRYFVAPGQENQSNLHLFYVQALAGQTVELDGISGRKPLDGIEIFSIKPV